MTTPALLTALAELALMLAVVVAYVLLARRVSTLWHPLSIFVAVGIVGMAVSVLGELLFRGGAGVPAMMRRSAIGSFGWGAVIAIVVWIGRRLIVFGRSRRHVRRIRP
jgi:hypothetical protein